MLLKFLNQFAPITFMCLIIGLTLASCNSTEGVLTPVNSVGSEQVDTSQVDAGQNVTAETGLTASQFAVTEQSGTGTKIHILPIVGAPADKIAALSRTLSANASSNGIVLTQRNSAETQYQLKGYLSAFSDETQTNVVYVWDILDTNSERIYRIQGQKNTSTITNDAWQAVSADIMEAIAAETITAFNNWQSSNIN